MIHPIPFVIPKLAAFPDIGDIAPAFVQRSPSNERFSFDTMAGRTVVLCFYGSATSTCAVNALNAVTSRRDLFDDQRAVFFGVCTDPEDERKGLIKNIVPGFRFFWDFDAKISNLYNVLTPQWVVIDSGMRIVARIPFSEDGSDRELLLLTVASQPPPGQVGDHQMQAPITIVPHVFEPALCQHLVELYLANGGAESGFMRQVDGRTVGIYDRGHKSRKDYTLDDKKLKTAIQARFLRKVLPAIAKVHQYHATRMERYIISCYSAEDGGHFRAHRDNTTSLTAHRRFAVSLNLNDEFDGGEVCFPEYGSRSFKAPIGGAVLFSCSLLHSVSTVTRGKRYAFLPFLYDNAAAQIRQENLQAENVKSADSVSTPAGG